MNGLLQFDVDNTTYFPKASLQILLTSVLGKSANVDFVGLSSGHSEIERHNVIKERAEKIRPEVSKQNPEKGDSRFDEGDEREKHNIA